jgi:hypothetical protein
VVFPDAGLLCSAQSQHYTLVDKEKNMSSAWSESTNGKYQSVCMFEDKGHSSAVAYVKDGFYSYTQTRSGRARSALLIEKHMAWAAAVIAWEEKVLENAGLERLQITPEVESKWDAKLVAARKELQSEDRSKCKSFMAMAKQFPFILRLNDDRGNKSAVETLSVNRLSIVFMTRVDNVINAFLKGT